MHNKDMCYVILYIPFATKNNTRYLFVPFARSSLFNLSRSNTELRTRTLATVELYSAVVVRDASISRFVAPKPLFSPVALALLRTDPRSCAAVPLLLVVSQPNSKTMKLAALTVLAAFAPAETGRASTAVRESLADLKTLAEKSNPILKVRMERTSLVS